jgi:DNA-binding NarL/FixJ family response regulator
MRDAVAHGAAGYLFKGTSAQQLAAAVLAVARGERAVVEAAGSGLDPAGDARVDAAGDWPGRAEAGLSMREAEILSFIGLGMSNEEIAASCFLSINSVKTYIRTAYRKIGVTRRAQAVRWALENGLVPGSEVGPVRPTGMGAASAGNVRRTTAR